MKWLIYEKFKTLEKNTIKELNNQLNINVIEELIESLNNLDLGDEEKLENSLS